MSILTTDLSEEERIFEVEVEKIEAWWRSPRQQHLKRPYSARQIAALRGTLQIEYPSSAQAVKLWNILREHHEKGTAEMTFGMVDPVLASQMIGQKTIYVSGALCAFSLAECSGQDTSDYPWDTVPKAVDRIFKSQTYHDRRQRHYRMSLSKEERAKLPEHRDYLQPIVADGDMGFGTSTAVVKLVKSFVESGVAMFHLDDLALGMKKFTSKQNQTVVPTSEYIKRLATARMQLDIMGAETLIMCRCDTYRAETITSVIDPRDHAYVLGATVPIESMVDTTLKAGIEGKNIHDARRQWIASAKLMTFDDAVKQVASESEYTAYLTLVSKAKFPSLSQRRQYASTALNGKQIFFDWDLARNCDGLYMFAPTLQTVLDRTLAAAGYGDVTWARLDGMVWSDIVSFHESFRKVDPTRLFGFGYSATFDFAANGYTPEHIEEFHLRLAKMGIVWQVQPGFALQGLNYVTKKFSNLWAERGIGGYVKEIQEPALAVDTDGFEKMSWSGGYMADALAEVPATADRALIL